MKNGPWVCLECYVWMYRRGQLTNATNKGLMIFEVLKILAKQVDDYIDGQPVVLGNIAMLESSNESGTNINNRLVMSMINLQEESTLKNFRNEAIVNDRVQLKNPIINLNLYILFSSTRNSYEAALKEIADVVEFFQGKKVFTQANTVFNRNSTDFDNIDNFRFTVDLYTPTFEELNYIWGTLGGKQLPSVLYKLSLIQIERDVVARQSGILSENTSNLSGN